MASRASSDHRAESERPSWLPDFCTLQMVFALMVTAEMVAVIVHISEGSFDRGLWNRLSLSSLFVQWLAITSCTALCYLRPHLNRLPRILSHAIAWSVIPAITITMSLLVVKLDIALAMGLTVPPKQVYHFVSANGVIAGLVSALALRYLYVQAQWRSRIKAEGRARFQALQARIRPHFLFNSMNTIAGLIPTRPAVAEQVVEDLADLFRAAMQERPGHEQLSAELDLVRRYLAIEKLRLGDRLQVDWAIEPLPDGITVPPFVLQPLVENAVYHGVQSLAEGGRVALRGSREGDLFVITVENPYRERETRHAPGNQMALQNIRQRLQWKFGDAAQLIIERLHAAETTGSPSVVAPSRFLVTLRLPITG